MVISGHQWSSVVISGRLAHLQSSEVIRGHQWSSEVISGRLAHLQVHSGKLDILQTRLHSVVARDRRAKVDRIRAVTAVDDLMREAGIVHSETQSDCIRAIAAGRSPDNPRPSVISGHQRSSVVISGHQWSSVVITWQSEAFGPKTYVISGHQWSSVVISGHQGSSVVITWQSEAFGPKTYVISGHQWSSVVITWQSEAFGPKTLASSRLPPTSTLLLNRSTSCTSTSQGWPVEGGPPPRLVAGKSFDLGAKGGPGRTMNSIGEPVKMGGEEGV